MKKFVTSFLAIFFLMAPAMGASFLPNDTFYGYQWYLTRIQAPAAWEKVNTSPDITIAVIDAGVEINHPDLKDNIWINVKEIPDNKIDDDANGFIDDVNGWDFVENIPDPSPKFDEGWTESGVSHGTTVAGIIAATGNNRQGIAGVTWRAKLMPLRALNDKGEGKMSSVVRAIDYAIHNGADIINLSFVGFSYSQALQDSIQRAYDAGVIVVAAAGNEQTDGEGYNSDLNPIYPACYDGQNGENMVIGVAATDALDQKADFSSYGFKCVDITAPGLSFFGAITPGGNPLDSGKEYDGFWSGTSMAAPVVSGSLALIAETNPQLRSREIVDILFQSADNISRLNPDYLGQLGSGRVNVDRAVNIAKERLYSRLGKLMLIPNTPSSNIASSSALEIRDKSGVILEDIILAEAAGGQGLASGDVDANGEDEIVVGSPVGSDPYINIYGPKGDLRGRFLVYGLNFKGGFSVAVADINDDGKAEIIVGAGAGGGPHVRIFDHKGILKGQFFAYEDSFRGGVNVAAGNIDGRGAAEIITARGQGGEPEIKIFDRHANLQGQFFAYERSFKGGVQIAIANTDGRNDNNKDEIIVSPGPGREPLIKVFSNKAVLKKSFLAYGRNWQGGVNVASTDLDNDGRADIVTGAMSGAAPHVRVFSGQGELVESFYAYADTFIGGVKVAVINIIN
ncbi:MAG: S8 family serine peptidase [Patescibacteria group bacterium]|nr:S8 family serine peptidase [Patescibacteria group bacterium]